MEDNNPQIEPQETNNPEIIVEENKAQANFHDTYIPTVVEPETKPQIDIHDINSPGIIVLQWLTYAFWFLTLIATSVLTTIIFTFFLTDANIGNSVAYGIAATVVFLIAAIICDLFYSKHEPVKKHGVASVVMIIHSVIFALVCIGALTSVVFSLVNLLVESSGSETALITLYSSLIVTLLYAVLFIRTILPSKIAWIRKYARIFMIVAVVIMVIIGFAGPVAEARLTRNDRLIVENLSSLQSTIDRYTDKNNKLPNSLSDLELDDDEKKLVTNNLVTYKKEGVSSTSRYTTEYKYQLCVTFVKASDISNKYNYYDDDLSLDRYNDGYSSYISTYNHPKGDVCYKIKTSDSSYSLEDTIDKDL